jgi:hypothetical protein
MPSIFQMALFTGLILVFDETKIQAQFKTSRYEFGVNAGTLVYQGDLTPGNAGNYRSLKPALAFSVSRLLTQHFALSANLTLGKLTEDESRYDDPLWRQSRRFSFTTRITELSTLAVWNFTKADEYHQPRFIPYVFAGAGLTLLHTRKDWSKVNTAVYGESSQVQVGLAIDTLKSANSVIAVLPLGVGLKYRFTSQMFFNTSFTYRFTSSDYIDGFKYSGNATKKDGYYGMSLGILYTFGHYKCPPVK